jgi:hypothetical protein
MRHRQTDKWQPTLALPSLVVSSSKGTARHMAAAHHGTQMHPSRKSRAPPQARTGNRCSHDQLTHTPLSTHTPNPHAPKRSAQQHLMHVLGALSITNTLTGGTRTRAGVRKTRRKGTQQLGSWNPARNNSTNASTRRNTARLRPRQTLHTQCMLPSSRST